MLFTIASLVASGFTVGPAAHVARQGVRATTAQMFAVTLVMEDGSKSAIECAGDTYVLDQAEEDGRREGAVEDGRTPHGQIHRVLRVVMRADSGRRARMCFPAVGVRRRRRRLRSHIDWALA